MKRRPLHPIALLAAFLGAMALGSAAAHCAPKALDCRVEFTPAPEGGCAARDAGAD